MREVVCPLCLFQGVIHAPSPSRREAFDIHTDQGAAHGTSTTRRYVPPLKRGGHQISGRPPNDREKPLREVFHITCRREKKHLEGMGWIPHTGPLSCPAEKDLREREGVLSTQWRQLLWRSTEVREFPMDLAKYFSRTLNEKWASPRRAGFEKTYYTPPEQKFYFSAAFRRRTLSQDVLRF